MNAASPVSSSLIVKRPPVVKSAAPSSLTNPAAAPAITGKSLFSSLISVEVCTSTSFEAARDSARDSRVKFSVIGKDAVGEAFSSKINLT